MLERAQYRQDAFIMLENFVTQVGCPQLDDVLLYQCCLPICMMDLSHAPLCPTFPLALCHADQ